MKQAGAPYEEQDIIFVDRVEEEAPRIPAQTADAHAGVRSDSRRAIVGMTGQYTLQFAGGFAIEFASPQDDRAVERLITHNT